MASKSETVQIIVNVTSGQATRVLNQLGGASNQSAQGIQRTTNAMKLLQSVTATMVKALLSMVAVLIAFNLLITIPERILQGLASAFKFAFDAVSDFEQGLLSIQAILASTVAFSKDAGENFKIAGEAALAVHRELIKEAARTPATLEQIREGFQALIGAGGLQFVKNLREAVQLNTLLVNSTLALTIGQDASRQIATEIRAILTGQVLAGTQLARILGLNTTRLKVLLEEARKNKNLFEVMKQLLEGFDLAAVRFGNTWKGLSTTFETFAQILGVKILQPFATFINNELVALRDSLDKGSGTLDNIAATLGAVILVSAQSIVGEFKSLGTSIIPNLAGNIIDIAVNMVRWKVHVDNLLIPFRILFTLIKEIASVIFAILKFLAFTIVNLANVFLAAFKGPVAFAQMISTLAEDQIATNNALNVSIGEAANNTVESLKLLTTYTNADIKAAETRIELEKTRAQILKEIVAEQKKSSAILDQPLKTKFEVAEKAEKVKLQKTKLGGVERFGTPIDTFARSLEDLMRVLKFMTDRAAERFSEFIDKIDIVLDRSNELSNRVRDIIANFSNASSGGFSFITMLGTLREAVSMVQKEIELLNKTYRDLDRQLVISTEAQAKVIIEKQKQITARIKQLTQDQRALIAAYAQTIKPFANAFSEFVSSVVAGGITVGQALKKMIGEVISAIGDLIIAYGIAMMAQGFLFQRYDMVAKGALYIALGAAVKAVGALIASGGAGGRGRGGGGAGEGAGAGGGGGNRTIFLTPFNQTQETLNSTLDRLNDTLNEFDTVKPGVVVKKGLRTATPEVLMMLRSRAQSNQEFKKALGGALLEEPI